jgi:hypothetical protein
MVENLLGVRIRTFSDKVKNRPDQQHCVLALENLDWYFTGVHSRHYLFVPTLTICFTNQ